MQKLTAVLALFLICLNSKAIDPWKSYPITPDSLNIKYLTHLISSVPDSIKLYSWELLPDTTYNGVTLVVAGGDKGNMCSYLYFSKNYLSQGYRIILFDYRGFGKSTDIKIDKRKIFYSEFGEDLMAVVAYYKKTDERSKLGVVGFSMGALAYNFVAKKLKIDFLICDSPPLDVNKGIKLLKKDLYEFSNDKNSEILNNFSAIEIPFLYFIGNKDIFINTSCIDKIIKNSKGNLIIYDGKHLAGGAYFTEKNYGDVYYKIILAFLSQQQL